MSLYSIWETKKMAEVRNEKEKKNKLPQLC